MKISRMIEEIDFGFGLWASVDMHANVDVEECGDGFTYEFSGDIVVEEITIHDDEGTLVHQVNMKDMESPNGNTGYAVEVMVLDDAAKRFRLDVKWGEWCTDIADEIADMLDERDQEALDREYDNKFEESRM